MKNLSTYFARISATLIVGLLISFGISTVLATYTPSETPGTSYTLITPNFNALLVGSGTDPTSAGDLKVTGNSTVIGDVITDTLDNYSGSTIAVTAGLSVNGTITTDTIDNYTSGGPVNISAPATATTFGDIYYKEGSSSSYRACNAIAADCPSGSTSGFYYTAASCSAGDYILGCTGWISSSSTTAYFKGAYVVKSSTQYLCKAYGNTTSINSLATCYSASDKQGTNSSSSGY